MTSTEYHPLNEIARFAEGEASHEERLRVIQHLLHGCSSCGDAIRARLLPETDPEALDAAVDRVLDRSQELFQRIDTERSHLEQEIANIERLPAAQQEQWIDGMVDLERRTACEMLVSRCRDSRHEDAVLNRRLAELAVRAAEGLEGPERAEVAARAWAELSNARRIPGDLTGAEQALTQAEQLAEGAGVDASVQADILVFRAALAHDQRQYDQAMSYYEEAREICRRIGDEPREISVLISMGPVQSHRSEPRDGIPYVHQALERLEQVKPDQPELHRIALHNLAHLSLEAGDLEATSRHVETARPLFETGGPYLDRLRFEWLVGRLQRDRGELDRAAEALERVRQSYLEEDLPYEVALVALDLAAVYVRLRKREKLRELAAETVSIFRALGIAQESIMALSVLAQVGMTEAMEQVAQLSATIERRHPRRGSISTADLNG